MGSKAKKWKLSLLIVILLPCNSSVIKVYRSFCYILSIQPDINATT